MGRFSSVENYIRSAHWWPMELARQSHQFAKRQDNPCPSEWQQLAGSPKSYVRS
jgi:hypothetical protein